MPRPLKVNRNGWLIPTFPH